MTFWDFLHRSGPGWPTARGWYAIALFLQTCGIIAMITAYPALTENEFFKSIATAIVITGWIGFAIAGRDNRIDREQVGQAQDISQQLLDHMRTGPGVPRDTAAVAPIPDPKTETENTR
jgi:hypothetical protein